MNERRSVVLHVVGARPNLIKVAPVLRALRRQGDLDSVLVHTGQHYDDEMSGGFFRCLEIPEPDVNLGVGSESHAVQTARVMERLEPVLERYRPRLVLVYGDVNSTMAAALVACKLHIPVGHVEAGLRSFDRSMPEEINRIVTDSISDLLFVTEASGIQNLRREGHSEEAMHLVGNVMIDSLEHARSAIEEMAPWKRYGVDRRSYALLTMHRPSNVDDGKVLARLLDTIARLSKELQFIFPVHPRTRRRIRVLGWQPPEGVRMCAPVTYVESLALQRGARVVVTDSGGVQEEASCLRVPCLTLRDRTERPITVELGSSHLVGNDSMKIIDAFHSVLDRTWKRPSPIPLWDGHAAERIAEILVHVPVQGSRLAEKTV